MDASKKELEEEHTREIEVENAFKTYQEAISLQNSGKLTESYLKYRELANSNVIVNHHYEEAMYLRGLQDGNQSTYPDLLSFVPQNVKSIRFLFFRNRGFLHYNILKSGLEVISDTLDADFAVSDETTKDTIGQFTKELFYTMMDGFVNCAMYQELDETLLSLLYEICTYFGLKRMARFTFEYATSLGSENDDIYSILPMNDWATKLQNHFSSVGLTESAVPEEVQTKLSFLEPLKEDFDAQCVANLSVNTVEVSVSTNAKWEDVLAAFDRALKDHQDRNAAPEYARHAIVPFNSYSKSESTFDSVSIIFTEPAEDGTPFEDHVVNDVETQPMDVEAPTEVIVEEAVSEIEPTAKLDTAVISVQNEKVSMRASRRLNPDDTAAPIDADDILLTRHYFVETELYFKLLDEIICQIFDSPEPLHEDVVKFIVALEDAKLDPPYIQDFLKSLNKWRVARYTPILLPDDAPEFVAQSNTDHKKLIEVLTNFGNQLKVASLIPDTDQQELDQASIQNFLSLINEDAPHFNTARHRLLCHLLQTITSSEWGKALYLHVVEWIVQLENEIFVSFSSRKALSLSDVNAALAIHEILVNSYIMVKETVDHLLETGQHELNTKSTKSSFAAKTIELLGLNDKIERWATYLHNLTKVRSFDMEQFIRLHWAESYFIASKSYLWEEKKYVVIHMNSISATFKPSERTHLRIAYPNYTKIGEFSAEGLHRRLSTSSILTIFSKILDHNESEVTSTTDTISLLESILVESAQVDEAAEQSFTVENALVKAVIEGGTVLDTQSLVSVKQFFNECPVELKLSLWKILFLYFKKDSLHKFQKGFEQFLRFFLGFLSSEAYLLCESNKTVLFLTLLSSYREYLTTFLKLLSEARWQLPDPCSDASIARDLMRVYELCYCFSLHEESALITGRKVSLLVKSPTTFQYFKDLFVDSVTILMVYCVNKSGTTNHDETVIRLLSMVHHQLGLRRLCDSSNGLFLKFAGDILIPIENCPAQEVTQLLACRFHYKVKINGKFPVDHYTIKSAEMDKNDAIELTSFILPLCYKSNPYTNTPRNDLRQVVDDLYELVGDADVESDPVISENVNQFNRFLEMTTLSHSFVKRAFYGLARLEFAASKSINKVATAGLYFLEAVLMFNSYKIRKKSAQSRTVELERIIELLRNDLAYGNNRAESWALLGQALGFQVEDDLIWTSDKINIIERKVITANVQRKSLICYMMAVSTLVQTDSLQKEGMKPVVGLLMNTFSKEFYSATRSPMDMIAFKVTHNSRFVRKKNDTLFLTLSDKPCLSNKFCLELMHRCLTLAKGVSPDEWSTLFYLAKVKAKLDKPPSESLAALKSAIIAAKQILTTADPLLDPVYKYYSLLYKLVKKKKLSVEQGIEWLLNEPLLAKTPSGSTEVDLYKDLCSCFAKLLSMDKKGWYHKPSYRQAKIVFDELNDTYEAKKLMSKFFTLKANSKTFLQMWKPEHERPGKHFVYMYQYSQFYIGILTKQNDLSSLMLMAPRLRRANSTMVLLYFAWENICASICRMSREIMRIEDDLVEQFLAVTPHGRFLSRAKVVVELVQFDEAEPVIQRLLVFLHVITEIRKLNNGFGPTSLIDDTFTGIFVKLFVHYAPAEIELEEVLMDSRLNKAKRLAKKDLIPFLLEVFQKCKRSAESFMKDHPDIFNEYGRLFAEEELVRQAQRTKERLLKLYRDQRVFSETSITKQIKIDMTKMLRATVPRYFEEPLTMPRNGFPNSSNTVTDHLHSEKIFVTRPPTIILSHLNAYSQAGLRATPDTTTKGHSVVENALSEQVVKAPQGDIMESILGSVGWSAAASQVGKQSSQAYMPTKDSSEESNTGANYEDTDWRLVVSKADQRTHLSLERGVTATELGAMNGHDTPLSSSTLKTSLKRELPEAVSSEHESKKTRFEEEDSNEVIEL